MNRQKKSLTVKGAIICLTLLGCLASLLVLTVINSSGVLSKGRHFWEQVLAEEEEPFEGNPALANLNSKQAILINLETNETIGTKGATKRIYPASLTKIMTAYIVVQQLTDLDKRVRVPEKVFDQLVKSGASMSGFMPNEQVPAIELLYGTLLSSGAEATTALAIEVAGSEKEFVKLMNQEVEKLGLKDTQFKNVTGLHHYNHYTTVEDIATLLKAALQNQTFSAVFSAKERIYNSETRPDGLYLPSTLFGHLPENSSLQGELIGGKTGYTDEAGQCLASLATINSQRYLLVTAGANGTPMSEARHIEDAFRVYQSL